MSVRPGKIIFSSLMIAILLGSTTLPIQNASSESLALNPGEKRDMVLSFTNWDAKYMHAWADASGEVVSWVTPGHIDFGILEPGMDAERSYTIKVPENQEPRRYQLTWNFNCEIVYSDTTECIATDVAITITVPESGPFDFKLSADPESLTFEPHVRQARWVHNITVDLLSGIPEPVTLSVELVGNTAQNPPKVEFYDFAKRVTLGSHTQGVPAPQFVAELLVYVFRQTPAGAYNFKVTAEGGGVTKDVTVTIVKTKEATIPNPSTVLVLDPPPPEIIAEEDIRFTGYLQTANGAPIANAWVSIYFLQEARPSRIEDIAGLYQEIDVTQTDVNGKFDSTCHNCFIEIESNRPVEVFAAFNGSEDYEPGESQHHMVNIQVTEKPIISIQTDKEYYRIGEEVFVSGFLSEVQEGEDVHISIINPYGWTWTPTEVTRTPSPNGRFAFPFTIGGEYTFPGMWTIVASVSYKERVAWTIFRVVEEEVEPEKQIVDVDFEGETFPVNIQISNGRVSQIKVDPVDIKLVIEVAQAQFGIATPRTMLITLPRDLIDATLGGQNKDFIVLANGKEQYYEEIETTDVDRKLRIEIPVNTQMIKDPLGNLIYNPITIVEIVGTRVGSVVAEQIETVLKLDRPQDRAIIGDVIEFTGSLISINGEPIPDALIWILNDDGVSNFDTLVFGFTDENGNFQIPWTVQPTDMDNDVMIFALFEGGQNLEGFWINEAISNHYRVTLEEASIFTEPETEVPYMGLIGVWDKDPINIVVVKDEGTPKEYEDDVVFAFKEWSRLLKETSGNSKAWNFDIVKDSKRNIFKSKPDVFVEIKLDDEGAAVGCTEAFGYASPRVNSQKRFEGTVSAVVFAACNGDFFERDQVRLTSMHELAHSFGIGHAWNKEGDLMCSAEYLYGAYVNTCNPEIPNDDKPSKLNLDAVLLLYNKDGFAEPNISPVPEIYAPQGDRGFFYIKLSTNKMSYSKGETMKVIAEVFDSSGKPADIEPSLIGISSESTKLGAGKYLFEIHSIQGGKNEFTIQAGQYSTALSIAAKERAELEELDVSVVMKQKKKLTLISVKNSDIEEIFGVKIKVSDGSIKFVKARGWDRDRIDQSTIVVSTDDRPIMMGRNLIIMLISDNPSASMEWSVIGNSGNEIGKGMVVSR